MLSFSTSPSFIMVNSVVGNSLPKGNCFALIGTVIVMYVAL